MLYISYHIYSTQLHRCDAGLSKVFVDKPARKKTIWVDGMSMELENQKLTELRDWLLSMLMNGQIKIKDAERKLVMATEPDLL